MDSNKIGIMRDGHFAMVSFADIRAGDYVIAIDAVVKEGAHFSGDASYDGYLFYDTDDNGWFPEDFAEGPCQIVAKPFAAVRTRFTLPVGDYSYDGHGVCCEVPVSSAGTLDEVRTAHLAIPEKTGVDLEKLCAESAVINPDVANRVRAMGYEFPPHYVDDEGLEYFQDEESAADNPALLADLWIWLLNRVNPSLDVQFEPLEDLPSLLVCGRGFGSVGYGLFVEG